MNISTALNPKTIVDIDNIVENTKDVTGNKKYESRSHFIRVATLVLIRDENKKGV